VSLADYGKWIIAVTGLASAYFVVVATFLEFNGHRTWVFRGVRVRFFRWWRHELTASQVLLDLGLTVVLLPATLFILFKVNVLSLSSNSTASMWYYAVGFTVVVVITVWRADATMRAKGRERRRLEQAERDRQQQDRVHDSCE
jgi:hypothetical protein